MKNLKASELEVGMLVNHPLDSFHTNQRVLEIDGNAIRFMYFPQKQEDWDLVDPHTTFTLIQR